MISLSTCIFVTLLQTYDPSVNYDSDSDSDLNNTKVNLCVQTLWSVYSYLPVHDVFYHSSDHVYKYILYSLLVC